MFADTSILDAFAAVTLATTAAVTVNVAAAIEITAIPAAAVRFLLGALLLVGLVVVFVVIIVHFNFLLR